jgi:hypothetical protein
LRSKPKSSKLPHAPSPHHQPGPLRLGGFRVLWQDAGAVENYGIAPWRSCAAPPQRASASPVASRTFLAGRAWPKASPACIRPRTLAHF